MDYSSDNDSGDEQIPQPNHHHKFLTELGHAAEDIGKGVATSGIAAVLF